MKKGDTFKHKGINFKVDKVLTNGKVKAITTANVFPKVVVIHLDNIV